MSRVYDNWERLVAATLKRDQLRQIALCPSLSSSSSIDSSSRFSLDSLDFVDDAPVGTVRGSLNSAVVVQEIGLAWGLKNELNILESIVDTVQLVLQDAESKQRKNEALQNWLRKLKDIAYDAENLLDQIATEYLRRRVASKRGKLITHKLNSFVSLRNPLVYRFRIAYKVKNMRERLDAIAERLLNSIREREIMDHQVGSAVENIHTSSLVNESEIHGRHEEKELNHSGEAARSTI